MKIEAATRIKASDSQEASKLLDAVEYATKAFKHTVRKASVSNLQYVTFKGAGWEIEVSRDTDTNFLSVGFTCNTAPTLDKSLCSFSAGGDSDSALDAMQETRFRANQSLRELQGCFKGRDMPEKFKAYVGVLTNLTQLS